MGNQPLVVIDADEDEITVRYGTQGRDGVAFLVTGFSPEELETQIESIDREAEMFKTLTLKQKEVNSEMAEPTSPSGISHLN